MPESGGTRGHRTESDIDRGKLPGSSRRSPHDSASGWYARILQHEIEHLNGTLYVDRMIPQTLMTVDAHKRFWRDTPVAQVLEQTGMI